MIPWNPGLPCPPELFVGRDDLRRRMVAAVRSGNSVGLVGPPGIGKTSLLRELARDLLEPAGALAGGSMALPVYMGRNRVQQHSASAMLVSFVESLAEALRLQRRLAVPMHILRKAQRDAQSERLESALKGLLDWAFAEEKRAHHPILLLDDLHRIGDEPWFPRLTSILYTSVDQRHLTLVLAGKRGLSRELRDDASVLRHLISRIHELGPLSAKETAALLVRARKQGAAIQRGAAAVAHELTGGHPYRLHYYLLEALTRWDKITTLRLRQLHAEPEFSRILEERLPEGAPLDSRGLERLIKKASRYFDVARWRAKLGELEACVCRVEIDSVVVKSQGTGFLVGPGVVLTNYHVMVPVIEGKLARPEDVILRFDFKHLEDGTTLNDGTEHRLAPAWLIDQSPFSPVDQQIDKIGLPRGDHLDYALVRLAASAGEDPVAGGARRGWIRIPDVPYDFPPDAPLAILQHPKGKPLKLAFESEAVIGVNINQTRVTYRTSTEVGSSGAPCFNFDWELVALHHSGDPDFDPGHDAEYNEGIPIATIVALLKRRGHGGALG